jgi:histidine triad (HIT) family protein
MKDSIFTKIIKGEILCYKVYEDQHSIAFLDINPVQPGHTLVVCKQQVEFWWDLEDQQYLNLMQTVKKVGKRLKLITQKPYVGIKVIGVDVPHVHYHLIPFSSVDEFNAPPSQSDANQLANWAKKLYF